jgi:hypothetical protein
MKSLLKAALIAAGDRTGTGGPVQARQVTSVFSGWSAVMKDSS